MEALRGVDVEVLRGEFLAIRGPSGSGKSTLLHCLSGLSVPDAGTVRYDDIDLASVSDNVRTDLRAQRMGFIFQTLNLLPALTVAENVELPLVLGGLPAAEIRSRRDAALADVEMADRAAAFPAQLSGGEQQRVALARALITEPEVLWADEPTGALDTANAAQVLALLRAAVERGSSVVVVSHADEVVAGADRVVSMRDGRVVLA